ncbi:hypothetical protein C8R47DRAFT_951995, partial [Mycena vitilis]
MPFTTRRLTELSFEALSDAGIDYRNQKIGSFMSGVSHFERPLSTEGSFAGIPSAPANRIAYVLGITGPSVQLDTACNSSLTALHLAILAMEAGDCTAALVGAAQINREVAEWRNYCLSGVLSSDGITKPFDDGADGFGRGEGAAVVVIKPLEDALRDNDHIYSVIVGSAINSTGSLMPLSVPSGVAQKECIQTAYMRAGLRPTDADFAELHITGTSVGDPIEANAAGEIFARQEHLDVGSVKGNLGHLEVAAFLVSLLKVCLIFEKKTVPPTVNLSTPSRAIHWDRHRLHVPTAPKPLSCRLPSGRSIASISGAGIGGSTGHVVVESPPERPNGPVCVSGEFPVVVMVGGLSPRAVSQICESIRKADFSSIGDMRACATTLSRRVRQLPWRTYFTLPILPRTEILPAILVPTASPPLIFLFSGQGPQNLEMGRRLYSSFPVFRATIIELDDVYRRVVGESLIETTGLFVSPITSPSILLTQSAWPVTITVAAIAMLQMALFDLSLSVGITPSAFVGHSAGETAILYTSGAGSKAMALEIAIARGQAMTVTERDDLGMAALACGADAAEKIISQIAVTDGALEISCFNSSVSVALSGSVCHLGEAIALARSQGIFAQRIRTMVPGHSSYMDVIKDDYLARMADVFARYPGSHIPNVPVFSTCTGKKLVAKFCPAYFWDNCRKPVLFSQAISNLLASFPDPIFLEISCHPVLSSSILQHSVDERSVLCPMRRSTQDRGGDEPALFTETLAQITLLGYNACDLSGLYGPSDYKGLVIDHPWVYRTIPPPGVHFSYTNSTNGVNGSLSTNISINEYTHPRLAQHVINGEPILPATGYIEILLKAGANFLWDVEFSSFYSLSAKKSTPMILERSGYDWCLKSLNNGPSDPTAREHARGLMDRSLLMKSPESLDLDYLWGSLPKLEMEGFYESISSFASFGPAYRRVLRCHGGPSELVAHVQGPSPEESSTDCQLDPVALDACLHIMLHPAISKQSGAESMYLPATLGRFVHHGRGSTTGDWFSHIRRRAWYPGSCLIHTSPPSSFIIFRFQSVRRHLGFVNGHASIDGGHNFFFTAQKADSFDQSALPKAVSKMDLRHVVNYSFGKEMELRTYLRDMARNDHLQLYVIALKGRDAESGMGLCATLALEFPFWSVRFAIFQCAVQLSDPSQLLSRHHDLFEQGEHAIYFPEEGSPCLLRVVPSPAPAARDAPTPPLALGDSDHLVVDIISFQSTTASICAFVGQVVTSNRPGPSPGDAVAGITAQKMANRITVHSACLVALNTEYSLPEPGDVLKSVATTLIQDCLPKRPEASNSRARFLVATEDEFMFNVFAAHFEAETTQRDFQNDDPFERVDVLITDSHTSSQYPHLRHWVPRSGRFLLWDVVIRDSLQGLTSEVEDALKRNLPGLREASNSLREPRSPASSVTPNSKPSLQLFRHDKSYILLGGIGGLGVDLAVWMYQRGARHVILTSRRGIGSLDPARDVDALSKIAYLRSRHELELQLAKCDSTDSSAMLLLVNSLSVPIGGCFQLTLVLSDHLFLNQTQDTFADPHRAKLGVFETFAAVVKIEALDFYVAFSSFSGLIGHVGQSNYASASTVLEGALAHYSNAFSLVVPGIRDAGYLVCLFGNLSADPKLWSCLEDGLRKLRDGPSFIRYIPDLNWDSLHAKYPLPPAFRYLLSSTQHSSDAKGPCLESEEEILRTVLSAMEVERQDFDFNRPLLSYGLDSLSATRLSAALHPFVQVSQVQLLAGVSWSELRGSLLQSGDADRAPEGAVVDHYTTRQIVTTMLGPANPDNSTLVAETIVEICAGPGLPLIAFPGSTGSLAPLLALRTHFSGALWGVQVTDLTPISPFMTHAAFVTRKIREKQPLGPYRLCAFSGSAVLGVAVAKLLEEAGQGVIQLSFIDGFPLLW